MKKETKFYDEVLAKAEGYSQRFLEGTRRGKAMMNLLGFKRDQYQIRTTQEKPWKKACGWKPTSIQIIDHDGSRPICRKVIEAAEKIKECEFDMRIYYYKGELGFIFLEEVFDRKGKIEKIYHEQGNKVRRVEE